MLAYLHCERKLQKAKKTVSTSTPNPPSVEMESNLQLALVAANFVCLWSNILQNFFTWNTLLQIKALPLRGAVEGRGVRVQGSLKEDMLGSPYN